MTSKQYSKFTDSNPSFEIHLAAKFGDIITLRKYADDSRRTDENKSRATRGIALCRQENFKGYEVIKLDSKTIVVRHVLQLATLPLNQIILDTIKSLGRATANTALGQIDEPSFNEILQDDNINTDRTTQSPTAPEDES